ncbi:MAG: DUF4234 domain-containing protein [Armatimonadota bacterium]
MPILGIITCGLYTVYWYYKTSAEVQLALGRADEMSPGLELLLMIVTCGIYTAYWWHKYGKMVAELRMRTNLPQDDNAVLYLVLYLFCIGGLVNPVIMQYQLNQVWQSA